MLSEYYKVFHPYNIIYIFGIVFLQVLEYFEFNASLVMKSLLISNNFNCDVGIGFIVVAFYGLAETTFS